MFQITVLVSLKVYILCLKSGIVSGIIALCRGVCGDTVGACAAIQLISILGIPLAIGVLLFSSPPISCMLEANAAGGGGGRVESRHHRRESTTWRRLLRHEAAKLPAAHCPLPRGAEPEQ